MTRFFEIKTLGCKVNQFESESISQYLENHGWSRSSKNDSAEVCIVNTCTVTQKAAMQSRQAIRQAIRHNPGARIVVTGCYAQTSPGEIRAIEGVHDIIGHGFKHKIPEALIASNPRLRNSPPVEIIRDVGRERIFKQTPVPAPGSRTRPYVKVQDGCDARCTYCIVPLARGRSRSMPIEDVIFHIRHLASSGYKEVVLTGIHLGNYGMDLPKRNGNLLELLIRLEKEKPLERVRLSSIEPNELTRDIVELTAESSLICHHFHIPLQSGDNDVLKRMHRPYSRESFAALVNRIHRKIPDAAIGVDTLIGFPGERNPAFENTADLIRQLPVSYLHVFPFSRRRQTPAAGYPDQISANVSAERCKIMREIGTEKRKAFYNRMAKSPVKVLVEDKRERKTRKLKGISGNYMPILFDGPEYIKNIIVDVQIEVICEDLTIEGTLAT